MRNENLPNSLVMKFTHAMYASVPAVEFTNYTYSCGARSGYCKMSSIDTINGALVGAHKFVSLMMVSFAPKL